MNLYDGLRALIIAALFSITLYFILYFLTRDWLKAGILTSLALILFYSYGHVYNLFRDQFILGYQIVRHRSLGLFWSIGFILVVIWILRTRKNLANLNSVMNIIAVAALVLPLFRITTVFFEASRTENQPATVQSQPKTNQAEANLPDIYYIILDAYSREDDLKEGLGFDNSEFIQSLEERGFYVAKCSQSNYNQTLLSLTSSLNMNYLEQIYTYPINSEADRDIYRLGLTNRLKNNQVRKDLEALGYKTIAFETGSKWTEIDNADIYLTPDSGSKKINLFQGLNEFEVLVIRSSGFLFISSISPRIAEFLLPDLDYPNQTHRERILFTLASLETMPSISGPKFVFAHIISPHKPFVFGPNGEILEKEPGYRKGYPNQIKYLNKRISKIIDILQKESEHPPVIIIQADHGALLHVGENGRLRILNAFNLPVFAQESLYGRITPVNSFRILLNELFDYDYELLKDQSFKAPYVEPTNYELVPNLSQECD